jgi:hypothetical protein
MVCDTVYGSDAMAHSNDYSINPHLHCADERYVCQLCCIIINYKPVVYHPSAPQVQAGKLSVITFQFTTSEMAL